MALASLSLTRPIAKLVRLLGESGGLWLVGGAVRDALTGIPAHDIDVLTTLDATEVMRLAHTSKLRVVWQSAAQKHGLVRLTAPTSGQSIDVKALGVGSCSATDPRAQRALLRDLGARDLTINAMALPLTPPYGRALCRDEVIDPWGGQGDLAKRWVRPCGPLQERLSEDPLRVLRLARFLAAGPAWRLRAVERRVVVHFVPQLEACSKERRHVEVERALLAPCPSRLVRQLAQWGALGALGAPPCVTRTAGLRASRWLERHEGHLTTLVQRLTLLWLGLTAKCRGAAAASTASGLGQSMFSRPIRTRVASLVAALTAPFAACSGRSLAVFWLNLGELLRTDFVQLTFALIDLGVFERNAIAPFLRRSRRLLGTDPILTLRDLKIDGHVLQKTLGLTPGPHIKELLDELRVCATLKRCANEREALLMMARRKLNEPHKL